MEMWDRAKEVALGVVQLGRLGRVPFGGFITSLCVIPLIVLGRFLYVLSADFYYLVLIAAILSAVGLMSFVITDLPEMSRKTIVINRLLGAGIAFFTVPLEIKLVFATVLIFYVLREVMPAFILHVWKVNFAELPGVFSFVAADVVAGVTANLIMQLVLIFIV